jgi:hypothetical protein
MEPDWRKRTKGMGGASSWELSAIVEKMTVYWIELAGAADQRPGPVNNVVLNIQLESSTTKRLAVGLR